MSTTSTHPSTSPKPVNGTDVRAWIGVVFGLLWIGGLGSIAAVLLGRSVYKDRSAHGSSRSAVATLAIVLGVLGLAACALAAALVIFTAIPDSQ